METITQYSECQQSGDLQIVQAVDGTRFRTQVHIDSSYKVQSRAKIEVWHVDDEQWHEVVTLVPGTFGTDDYRRKRQVAEATATVMLRQALDVMFG